MLVCCLSSVFVKRCSVPQDQLWIIQAAWDQQVQQSQCGSPKSYSATCCCHHILTHRLSRLPSRINISTSLIIHNIRLVAALHRVLPTAVTHLIQRQSYCWPHPSL